MSDWPEITISKWTQFVNLMDQLEGGQPSAVAYSFRGQSDATWTLKPSLIRDLSNKTTVEQVVNTEKIAREEFESQAHIYIPPAQIPKAHDIVSWWALMQHYGVPTRLLDWSASPFVAAYFAAVEHWGKPGAIWYFHENRLRQRMQSQFGAPEYSSIHGLQHPQFFLQGAEHHYLYSVTRSIKSDRMVAQQSGSTLSTNVMLDHADLILSAIEANDEKEWFRKIVIPAESKVDFLTSLRRMNVTANSLFPGIDGFGRSVGELTRLELSFTDKEGE